MGTDYFQISVNGQMCSVPSMLVEGKRIIATGKWIKAARVHDEFFLEGDVVEDPDDFIHQLRLWSVRPDVFFFTQKITNTKPKFDYPFEFDNFAVLRLTTYDHWLKKQARKDVRENIRRAKREKVEVRVCEYDDNFVAGIKSLYDETPVRQGRPFWHFNKPIEKVKSENGTYLERSEYIGAFFEDELIGFIKMVYIGRIAKTMQVITKDRFFKKRPANAMIAKAVETCIANGIEYFNYGPYEYPGKAVNSLTDFKYRHGFERYDFPRYQIPLTIKGALYLKLGANKGVKHMIPTPILMKALKVRSKIYSLLRGNAQPNQ